jgi:hypothetical protein
MAFIIAERVAWNGVEREFLELAALLSFMRGAAFYRLQNTARRFICCSLNDQQMMSRKRPPEGNSSEASGELLINK